MWFGWLLFILSLFAVMIVCLLFIVLHVLYRNVISMTWFCLINTISPSWCIVDKFQEEESEQVVEVEFGGEWLVIWSISYYINFGGKKCQSKNRSCLCCLLIKEYYKFGIFHISFWRNVEYDMSIYHVLWGFRKVGTDGIVVCWCRSVYILLLMMILYIFL